MPRGREKRGGGALRVVALAGGGVLLLATVALVWFRLAPAVGDAELAEAERAFDEERARQAAAECPRDVLIGAPTPGDGTEALRALVDPEGRFAACMALDGDALVDAFMGNLGGDRTYRWHLPERPLSDGRPEHLGWFGNLALASPPYPEGAAPEILLRARGACGELPAAIHEVVAHESVCSPWRTTAPFAEPDFVPLFNMAKGLRAVARDALRQGDTMGAFRMLLEGARLMQDLGRGSVPAIVRMLAVAGVRILLSEVQTALALELHLEDAELETLRGWLATLADSEPPASDMLRGELTYLVEHVIRPALREGYEPPGGRDPAAMALDAESARLPMALAAESLEDPRLTCGRETPIVACLDGMRSALAETSPEPPSPTLMAVAGPKLLRGRLLEALRHIHFDAMRSQLERLGALRAQLRGLRALVGFHGRRRAGGCPGPEGFAAEDLAAPALGGPLTVFELAPDQQLEVHAPGALIGAPDTTEGLPILLTVCPGLPMDRAGRFFRGTEIEPPDGASPEDTPAEDSPADGAPTDAAPDEAPAPSPTR